MIRTDRYTIKHGNHQRWLEEKVHAVNFVWNWYNNAQHHAFRYNQKWLTGFDLNNLAAGTGKMLDRHSQTVQAICEKYAQSRSGRH